MYLKDKTEKKRKGNYVKQEKKITIESEKKKRAAAQTKMNMRMLVKPFDKNDDERQQNVPG